MSTEVKSDVIICGAGASGLANAIRIQNLSPELTIQLIDPDFERSSRKTWCFWDESVVPIPNLIKKSWKKISVINSKRWHTEVFDDPIYFCVHSEDYRNKIISKLRSSNSINFNQDSVTKINSKNSVETSSNSTFSANYLIDTRFQSIDDVNFHPSANTLWQHFKGWVIQTNKPTFDSDHAILMDFRVPQSYGFAFVYLLPYSDTQALVELTFFNDEIPATNFYDSILDVYLKENWDLSRDSNSSSIQYSIQDTEYGVIPMSDLPVTPNQSENQIKTGLIGGLAKASTGYAFSRIQRHSAILAKQISMNSVFKSWKSPLRFQYYDMLILHLLKTDPAHCVQIFMDLFDKNGFKLVFDFLDEKTSFADELKIMSSVPSYQAFFKSIWETRKKIKQLL